MEKVLLYEKAIGILNERYDFVKRYLVEGKRDIALAMYHTCFHYLYFMYSLDLIDYKEFCDLRDADNDFFDRYFLS